MMRAPAETTQEEKPAINQPHDIELEQALLGALFLNNDVYDRIADIVEEHHFFDPLHQRIYNCISSLLRSGKSATPVTMKAYFEKEEPIGVMTVPEYLLQLTANAVGTISAQDYAKGIKEFYLRRELVLIGQDIAELASDACPEYSVEDQIEEVEATLFNLCEGSVGVRNYRHISHSITNVLRTAKNALDNPGVTAGLPTRFIDIDRKLGGLHNSDLIILAGRPAMGKTSLATNIAFNVAKSGHPVGFFSLEMSDEQLSLRIISDAAEISSERIRNNRISREEFYKLEKASEEVARLPIHIDMTGGISIKQLAARARRMKRTHGIKLLVIDYIQLMSGNKNHNGNRVQEMTEITTGLKALAKNINIPIIALSQLSRQVENREDKRPQLADLRDSGSIEQDADTVCFLYREEYYKEKQKPDESNLDKLIDWEDEFKKIKGKADLIISKQRHGSPGTIKLGFRSDLTRFFNLSSREWGNNE